MADQTRLRLRAGLLWLGVSSLTLVVAALTAPTSLRLATAPAGDFADLLVQCCSVGALLAIAALWLLTSDVAAAVLHDPHAASRRRVGPLRRSLLALCGLAALTAAAPAVATADAGAPAIPAQALSGLPMPDRAEGQAPITRADRAEPGPSTDVVVVRPGDSLWTIAEALLGPRADVGDIADLTIRLHELNRAAIGVDPDLIHPGLHLRLPATPTSEGAQP